MKQRQLYWLKPENVKKVEALTKKRKKKEPKATPSVILDEIIEVYPSK